MSKINFGLDERIVEVNQEISLVRHSLNQLLAKKLKLMNESAKNNGCSCAFMISGYDVSRVHNNFCEIHKLEY